MWDTCALFLSGVAVAGTVLRLGARYFSRHVIAQKVLGRFTEKRKFERVKPTPAKVFVSKENSPEEFELAGELVDINSEAFMVRCDRPVEGPFPRVFKFKTEFRKIFSAKKKVKRAVCEGELYREVHRGSSTYEYVFTYTPVSPLNFYMIHQYFLRESVVSFP